MSEARIKDGLTNGQRWYLKNKERHNALNLERQRRLRASVLALLGDKCSNSECRWLNTDGTLGCTDARALQIDHIKGGGSKENRSLGSYSMCRKILAMEHPEDEYQLLCANCNWIKRSLNKEVPGAGPRKRRWSPLVQKELIESATKGNSKTEQLLRKQLISEDTVN